MMFNTAGLVPKKGSYASTYAEYCVVRWAPAAALSPRPRAPPSGPPAMPSHCRLKRARLKATPPPVSLAPTSPQLYEEWAAKIPDDVPIEDAAAVPLVALTALGARGPLRRSAPPRVIPSSTLRRPALQAQRPLLPLSCSLRTFTKLSEPGRRRPPALSFSTPSRSGRPSTSCRARSGSGCSSWGPPGASASLAFRCGRATPHPLFTSFLSRPAHPQCSRGRRRPSLRAVREAEGVARHCGVQREERRQGAQPAPGTFCPPPPRASTRAFHASRRRRSSMTPALPATPPSGPPPRSGRHFPLGRRRGSTSLFLPFAALSLPPLPSPSPWARPAARPCATRTELS